LQEWPIHPGALQSLNISFSSALYIINSSLYLNKLFLHSFCFKPKHSIFLVEPSFIVEAIHLSSISEEHFIKSPKPVVMNKYLTKMLATVLHVIQEIYNFEVRFLVFIHSTWHQLLKALVHSFQDGHCTVMTVISLITCK
jgi:hypothetical protein